VTGTAIAATDFTIFVVNGDATKPSTLTEVLHSAGYDARTYSSHETFFDRHNWTVPGRVLVDLRIKDGKQCR
jgi:FixJ family two-component response regulator